MRKLKLQMQVSLDGFVAGPNGEMDWMVSDWDEGLKDYVREIMEGVDCIVLGRKLAEVFIPHWAKAATNPDDPDVAAARLLTDTPKVVFSKTLESHEWDNTTLAKGDVTTEINELKRRPGKDIIAYGGANFVSNLIKGSLIDDYHFLVDPAAVGKGLAIFNSLESRRSLKLVQSRSFDCGIAVLNYRPG